MFHALFLAYAAMWGWTFYVARRQMRTPMALAVATIWPAAAAACLWDRR